MAAVRQNSEANQFEYVADNENVLGYLQYTVAESKLDLQHTFVDPAGRGKGIAGKLCDAAFDFASKEGLKVIPTCSYIETYLTKNPDKRSLV